MIPIDKYNKDFDMFLLGNLGTKNKLNQQLENTENLIVLIVHSEELFNWQHPKEITDSIKRKWNNIGNVMPFDVYMKK